MFLSAVSATALSMCCSLRVLAQWWRQRNEDGTRGSRRLLLHLAGFLFVVGTGGVVVSVNHVAVAEWLAVVDPIGVAEWVAGCMLCVCALCVVDVRVAAQSARDKTVLGASGLGGSPLVALEHPMWSAIRRGSAAWSEALHPMGPEAASVVGVYAVVGIRIRDEEVSWMESQVRCADSGT